MDGEEDGHFGGGGRHGKVTQASVDDPTHMGLWAALSGLCR